MDGKTGDEKLKDTAAEVTGQSEAQKDAGQPMEEDEMEKDAELEVNEAAKDSAEKDSKSAKKRRGRKKQYTTKAKRKRAVARAVIRKGKGRITVNHVDIRLLMPRYVAGLVNEPVQIAGKYAEDVDIEVNVHGGGVMAQAIAARGAIAKAFVEFSNDAKLKKSFLDYDRLLLVDDTRRMEPKKPLGTGARVKKQRSKR